MRPVRGVGVVHRRCTFRRCKRHQTDELDGVEPLAPLGLAEIEAAWRQRLVRNSRSPLGALSEVLPAGLVISRAPGGTPLGPRPPPMFPFGRGAREGIKKPCRGPRGNR